MNKKMLIVVGAICAALVITLVIVVLPAAGDEPPMIGDPSYTTPFATENIEINVSITDDKGIAEAILSYSNDSRASWHNITLTNTGNNTWSGDIPPQDIETTIDFKIIAKDTANQFASNDNLTNYFQLFTGSRKAFIVCSANDFYGSEFEDEFNGGPDSSMESNGTGRWRFSGVNTTGALVPGDPGHASSGDLQMTSGDGPCEGEFTYNWTLYYPLEEYAYYNMSAWIMISVPIVGLGARLGLRWFDSSNQIVRTDWSAPILDSAGGWLYLEVSGVCNNQL